MVCTGNHTWVGAVVAVPARSALVCGTGLGEAPAVRDGRVQDQVHGFLSVAPVGSKRSVKRDQVEAMCSCYLGDDGSRELLERDALDAQQLRVVQVPAGANIRDKKHTDAQ